MEILREQIKDIKKVPVILHKCLRHTLQNPQDLINVGVMWINDKVFILNKFILEEFTSIDKETIRKNLRQHGFDFVPLHIQEKRRIFDHYKIILIDSKSWVGRTNKFYNSYSSEEDAKNLHYRKKISEEDSNKKTTPQNFSNLNLETDTDCANFDDSEFFNDGFDTWDMPQ